MVRSRFTDAEKLEMDQLQDFMSAYMLSMWPRKLNKLEESTQTMNI